jgi:hypothetical protein
VLPAAFECPKLRKETAETTVTAVKQQGAASFAFFYSFIF